MRLSCGPRPGFADLLNIAASPRRRINYDQKKSENLFVLVRVAPIHYDGTYH